MCIASIALNAQDDYPLILAHNRDEYLARSTGQLELQPDGSLCAIDALGGGTWMGVNVRSN